MLTLDNEDHHKKIGVFEHTVQTDETVVVMGKLHTNSSSMYDSMGNTTRLVGSIDADTREMILEIVPDRSEQTMKDYFKRNIEPETLCLTDGHKSYPGAIDSIRGDYHVVIHEDGFKNDAGETTNLIDGVWALLKYEIKVKNGIKRRTIPDALEEFKWRRRCVKKYNRNCIRTQFIYLMTLFFNK